MEEFTVEEPVGPSSSNSWGIEPGASVRRVEMRSSQDQDAQIVKMEQIVLPDDAVERTGYPKVKHEIDVQSGDDGTPVEVAHFEDDGHGVHAEVKDRVESLVNGFETASQTRSAQAFSDMQDYLHWPKHLTATDEETVLSEDNDGNPVETTTRWAEFTEGGNDEFSDHVHVEQTVEVTHLPDGPSTHIQHSVSIRQHDGDWDSEDIFNSSGFDADQHHQVREHVEELLTERSNDAEGNSVFY
ncbi:MAG: hypothetical protein HLX51_00790 [Micrococcaceae bacterium]|nr:hypothetical protein [Micrococcaceae bacterium]